VSAEVDRVFGFDPATFDVAGVVRFEPGPELVVAGVSKSVEAVPLGSRFPPDELFAPTHVLQTGRSARIRADDPIPGGAAATPDAGRSRNHRKPSRRAFLAESLADEELLERVSVNHDEVAFDVLYARYARAVFALVARVLRGDPARGDAAQMAFTAVWREAGGYHRVAAETRSTGCSRWPGRRPSMREVRSFPRWWRNLAIWRMGVGRMTRSWPSSRHSTCITQSTRCPLPKRSGEMGSNGWRTCSAGCERMVAGEVTSKESECRDR